MKTQVQFKGWFDFTCRNADGSFAWRHWFPNSTCIAGINDFFTTNFASGTQKPNWFLGLIDNSVFSALSAQDTAGSHAGWTESTAYSESVRQTWTPGTPSGGLITNPSPAIFTMSGNADIKGAFLVSNSTKSGGGGILWATGAFRTVKNLTAGQALQVAYSCAGAGS